MRSILSKKSSKRTKTLKMIYRENLTNSRRNMTKNALK